jgi:hypothetical protein
MRNSEAKSEKSEKRPYAPAVKGANHDFSFRFHGAAKRARSSFDTVLAIWSLPPYNEACLEACTIGSTSTW